MISTRFGVLGALAVLPAFAQVSNVSIVDQPSERLARHQLSTIHDKLDHFDGTATSSNWSGWAVQGSSFTSAVASWTVATAVCTGLSRNTDEYTAQWVGIDGYGDNTVEQTGTLSWCSGSTPEYYAWYEFYPKAMYEILTVPVSPGNTISATVTYASSEFTVTITNVTTGKSYSTSSKVSGAQRSSAEWIVEAPCCTNSGGILPLSDFGTAYFGLDWTGVTGTNYATDSANSGDIASFGSSGVNITKLPSSTSPQGSTCSALSTDGTSFSCTWSSN